MDGECFLLLFLMDGDVMYHKTENRWRIGLDGCFLLLDLLFFCDTLVSMIGIIGVILHHTGFSITNIGFNDWYYL